MEKLRMLCFISLSIIIIAAGYSQANDHYTIGSKVVSVELTSKGKITSIIGNGYRRPIMGQTILEGLVPYGKIKSKTLKNGGVEFKKQMVDTLGDRQCTLIERFFPTPNSVRWEIEVQGKSYPWSTGIQTKIAWLWLSSHTKFWTTWAKGGKEPEQWKDPLVPAPFENLTLLYGSRGAYNWSKGFSLPLATIIDEEHDLGMSLVLSPEDTLFDLELITDEKGFFLFERRNRRIEANKPVRFAMDLIMHEGCWRPAIGWMFERYPEYFNPPNPKVYEISGCCSYSGYTGPIDLDKYRKMGLKVIWYNDRTYVFVGMYLPPVRDGEKWTSFTGPVTQGKLVLYKWINDNYVKMLKKGIYMLAYANFNEFCYNTKFPPPERKAKSDDELWKYPNDCLHSKFADAILYKQDNRAIYTWRNAVVVDPGEPVMLQHFVEQIKRHLEKHPAMSGICIDRMDWCDRYNYRRDDGLSWVDGRPARSLFISWKKIMSQVGPMVHTKDKVIYNDVYPSRLEMMREVDGIMDERSEQGDKINMTAFLGIRKPVICWISTEKRLKPNPDAVLQKHLYLGAYPMVPYPTDKHTIKPSRTADPFFLDYGPMFNAMQGRKWVLLPHVVEVENNTAKVNIFEVPDGYIIPVTFGGDHKKAKVIVRNLPRKSFKCHVILPGVENWRVLKADIQRRVIKIDVPLERGCAMVKLRK